MATHIKCVSCRFARQDKAASEYTQKHCKGCELREICPHRKDGVVCDKQILKWAAFECGNSDSEFYKALLNVTPGGDMQDRITWQGCPCGERGERL
jgi:hypothetical protein